MHGVADKTTIAGGCRWLQHGRRLVLRCRGVPIDTWDAGRYELFRAERERPLEDLLALLEPAPGGRAADLGCGTGRGTRMLHHRLGAAATIGIDSSAQMLGNASEHVTDGVRFVLGDLRDLGGLRGPWDVLFANASLHWLDAHDELVPELVGRLAPGGQLAFQVPANFDHPSHTVADEVGREFGLEPLDRHADVLHPRRYAEILWRNGLRELDVSLRIYGVDMARTDDVVAWVSGSLLTTYESRLDADAFDAFRARYRSRLLAVLGDPEGAAPYYYAFARILCRGRIR